MEEAGGPLSIGPHRVAHDWSDLACMHALEKEMATYPSVLAWRIPGTEAPGGLPSIGPQRVGHDWSHLAAAAFVLLHDDGCEHFISRPFLTNFQNYVDKYSGTFFVKISHLYSCIFPPSFFLYCIPYIPYWKPETHIRIEGLPLRTSVGDFINYTQLNSHIFTDWIYLISLTFTYSYPCPSLLIPIAASMIIFLPHFLRSHCSILICLFLYDCLCHHLWINPPTL